MSDVPPSLKESGKHARRRPARRLLPWFVGGVLAAAVAGFFAFEAWLNSYLASEAFRQRTEAAVGRALKARSSLAPLQRQGTTLASETLQLQGEPGASFASAEVQGVRAEVDLFALWGRLWRIEHLNLQRLNVDLNRPAPATPAPEPAAGTPPAAASPAPSPSLQPQPGSPPAWQRLLAGLLPNRTRITRVHTDRASFSLVGAELRQSRLAAVPSEAGSGWEIGLESGDLSVPGLPAGELQEAKFTLRNGGGGVLRSSRLQITKGGQAFLSGEWTPEGGRDFHARLENLVAEPFLPLWWRTRIAGLLQGSLRFQKSSGTAETLSGELKLTNGRLEAFPLLSQLDSFVGSQRFRQVALKTASAKLRRAAGRTEFSDIDLDADGILRLRGTLTIENGTLDGRMQLGIPPAVIQWLPNARTKMFGESRDGLLWTPFTVTGPIDQPVEDLTPRLANAAVEAVTDTLKKLPAAVPQGVPEAAKGLLEAVKSLLPGR
jgi:hypothetical protein